jgi:hypothetical protein
VGRISESAEAQARRQAAFDSRTQAAEALLGLGTRRTPPASKRIAPEAVTWASAKSLKDLLPAKTLDRLARRFDTDFTRTSHADSLDLLAAALCGTVAGAIDFLLVGIPQNARYLSDLPQKAGPLPELLRSWQVPADNFLARIARVPYDAVSREGTPVPGMHPRNHRYLTPGHDPLVGLVVGVFDIIRGGRTAFDPSGRLYMHEGLMPGENATTALVRWFLHLLSDVATPMGIPVPGWSFTPLVQFGSFGPKELTAAELAHYRAPGFFGHPIGID